MSVGWNPLNWLERKTKENKLTNPAQLLERLNDLGKELGYCQPEWGIDSFYKQDSENKEVFTARAIVSDATLELRRLKRFDKNA